MLSLSQPLAMNQSVREELLTVFKKEGVLVNLSGRASYKELRQPLN